MATWQNLTTNVNRNSKTNDDFGFAVLVDASIVDADVVTNVQINFNGSASSGTVHCCRWDNLATMTAENNGADLLTAANHTYWSKDATTLGVGMTNESVTQSTANVADNIIGFVLTGSGDDDLSTRFFNPAIAGYTTYKANSGSTDVYSRTLTFTITTAGGVTGSGTRLPPPPIVMSL